MASGPTPPPPVNVDGLNSVMATLLIQNQRLVEQQEELRAFNAGLEAEIHRNEERVRQSVVSLAGHVPPVSGAAVQPPIGTPRDAGNYQSLNVPLAGSSIPQPQFFPPPPAMGFPPPYTPPLVNDAVGNLHNPQPNMQDRVPNLPPVVGRYDSPRRSDSPRWSRDRRLGSGAGRDDSPPRRNQRRAAHRGRDGSPHEERRSRYRGKLQHFDRFNSMDPYVDDWLDEVSDYVRIAFDFDKERFSFVWGLLDRSVKRDLRVRVEPSSLSAVQLVAELRHLYSHSRTDAELRTEFHKRFQEKGESLPQFCSALTDRVLQLSDRTRISHEERDDMLKGQFATGVADANLKRELKRLVLEQPRLDFAELKRKAEDWMGGSEPSKKAAVSTVVPDIPDVPVEQEVEVAAQYAFKSRVDAIEKKMESQRDTLSRMEKLLESLSGSKVADSIQPTRSNPDLKCSYCGKLNHLEERCFKKTRDELAALKKSTSDAQVPSKKSNSQGPQM